MDRSKAIKKLSVATVEEMEDMSPDSLMQVIIDASAAMKTAKEELEVNPKYLEIKDRLAACTGAKRDLDSRQKARICFALDLLEAKGK